MNKMNCWSLPLRVLLMAPLGLFSGALVVAYRLWSGA
jgi:hypothetical protein